MIDKDIQVVTIERDVERYNEAISNIHKMGLENQITPILKDAFEVDGRSQKDEAILLRSELGMAIACKEKINLEKYLRAKEQY